MSLYFDSKYYGKGENKYEYAIVKKQDDIKENAFHDAIYRKESYHEYFFIPDTMDDGEYYFAFRARYIDGSKNSVSDIYSKKIIIHKPIVKNQLIVTKFEADMKYSADSYLRINYYPLPSVPFFKLLYKLGESSSNLDQYEQFYESQSPIKNNFEGTYSIHIQYDQREIVNKVSFIMVDSETSTILNSTEISHIKILPEFKLDTIQIDKPKDSNENYYLETNDVVSGTITFKNEFDINYMYLICNRVFGSLTTIQGNSKKLLFEIPLSGGSSPYSLEFSQNYRHIDVSVPFKRLDMNVNINKYLPSTGTIDGNIQISTDLDSSKTLKVVAKYGEYDSTISNYNIELDTKSGSQSFEVNLENKLTYDTARSLPTKITFAVIVDDVIASHKTIDIVILQDPQIESITDSSSSHQYKTNSRITLNIKRIKADAIEDYSFKYQFVDRNADMDNPIKNDLNKLKKVSYTENDFTLQFTIPNNVEAGEKDLLLKLVNPLNKESSVFRINLTITKG
ncbi:hypothetical protein TVAG_336670 [Trichomonas vaginalis G3]|uniref:Uncharacterized protein n=1 Tax=Trichomonas vaginalis (strain ATCC PRA-98 / G3) TaxID=412133 RepID=A2FLX1_TRIV3|nr:hypothetical protein TVAG_336670 [Trichomonas vaginalis G3]|eukprot:XP_001307034.1 hypothetical protein [Trichomonas vaginalis G3]